MRILSLIAIVALAPFSPAAEPEKLPKVVLIGDSIRMGYASTVAKKLEGKAVIVQSKANGGDSKNVLAKIKELAVAEQPDIVHFNCGIHDTKKDKKAGTYQVPPKEYEANLRKIVETIRKETKATVIFATTTPIVDERAAKGRAEAAYELLDASTVEYNAIALKVMKELNVPVNDLRAVVGEAEERSKLITQDGVHYTAAGQAKLGEAVAEFVGKYLTKK